MSGFLAASLLCFGASLPGQVLDLPPRAPTAMPGEEFARAVADLPLPAREERILTEVRQGNLPSELRALVAVTVQAGTATATYYVTPDYLAIGPDDDRFYVPLTPYTAQKVADLLGCSLPTPKMVDDIYRNASVKLIPSPIPPSPAMTTVPVFLEHNRTLRTQRGAKSPGALVAGHKKDVVIANRAFAKPGRVAIYGWHKQDGTPIQPLYTGHSAAWADYSHGIRLVQRRMIVNGKATTIDKVLDDPDLAPLLSDEGVMPRTRYDTKGFPSLPAPLSAGPGEALEILQFDHGVRVVINRPQAARLKPVLLIFYGLPNGNTIEQTIGRTVQPGDDWHYDIQHIGAQMRFLREAIPDRSIVVAYLENALKSWPAWRKQHGDRPIPEMVDAVRRRFEGKPLRIVLDGHSGGGSFTFGYLNQVDSIPEEVERIAFLDSNYAYESGLHRDKLASWLKSSDRHFLCVIAYNDAVALLNGKPFVSASGGTWGRSQLMLSDLRTDFTFTMDRSGSVERLTALQGRVTFLLRDNPEKAIYHTVQVERNGFIESVLSGTKQEGAGYHYFGDRAYTKWIRAD